MAAIAFVTISAAGSAVGANVALKRALAIPEGASVGATPGVLLTDRGAPDPSEPRVVALSQRQYVDGILRRNLFDSTAIGQKSSAEGDTTGVTQSDLKVVLKGTLVAEPAQYSTAFIAEDAKDAQASAYGLGAMVLGAKILEIRDTKVKILRDGVEEWIIMGDEVVSTTTTSGPTPTDEEGVEKVGENDFVVSRAKLDEYLNDMESLSRMGRALLHRGPDGEFDGYRLSAIRRGSMPDKLGIRNGDIIHNVNGLALNNVQNAMTAFSSLQSESGLKFEVTRRGQPVTLNYDIQ